MRVALDRPRTARVHGPGLEPIPDPGAPPSRARTSLGELALLFLRLGATSFGGPAAHVAMMEHEVVRRRGWLDPRRFLDLVGATNVIPGPNSTELALHVGWARRRWSGLLVSGLAFLLPAVLASAALAWAYVRYGALPEVAWVLYGVKPVILAIVAQALWNLAPRAASSWSLRALGLTAIAAAAFGVHELVVLFGAGLVALVARHPRAAGVASVLAVPHAAPVLASAAASSVTLPGLFWVFLKIGSVLFGSGYVLLAFLRADLVERLHWITEAQLLDAIAAGQVTPGPVFSSATFLGWLLAGPSGAALATVGIFLPAFVFVVLSVPFVERIRASRTAGAFLDGVNVASLALMAFVTFQLGRGALVDAATIVLALASAVLLLHTRVNSTWLVLGGALASVVAHALGFAR